MHKLWIGLIMGKWSIVLPLLYLCLNLTAVKLCSACALGGVPGTTAPPPERGSDWQASDGADSTHSLWFQAIALLFWQWGKVQLYLSESQASQLILYPGKVNELVFLLGHPGPSPFVDSDLSILYKPVITLASKGICNNLLMHVCISIIWLHLHLCIFSPRLRGQFTLFKHD